MLLMLSGSCPGSSIVDWARLAVETLATNPYPEFIKRDYYFMFDEDGIKTFTIFDIEKGREEEGLKDIQNRLTKFSISIEGMKAKLDPVFTLEDVFAVVGQLASLEPGSE